MANLQATTISSSMTITGTGLIASHSTSDVTDWYKLTHDHGSSTTRLHIRTPLGAETSCLGWNPSIIEVHGFHGYNGENVHDFKALVNVNGYNNDWYGSQIKSDGGYTSSPYVYRSSSSYGGTTRVCIAVNKQTSATNGYIWVRWFNNSNWYNSYAWAVSSSTDNTAVF